MGWGTLERSGTDWGTFGVVWDGSGDPLGGPGQVGGPSGRSGTGRGTIREVWDEFGYPGEIRDGSWTFSEVRDGSRATRAGPGWTGDPTGGPVGVWRPSERSETGRGLGMVRDGSWTFSEVRDRSGTLREVQDRSGDPR